MTTEERNEIFMDCFLTGVGRAVTEQGADLPLDVLSVFFKGYVEHVKQIELTLLEDKKKYIAAIPLDTEEGCESLCDAAHAKFNPIVKQIVNSFKAV